MKGRVTWLMHMAVVGLCWGCSDRPSEESSTGVKMAIVVDRGSADTLTVSEVRQVGSEFDEDERYVISGILSAFLTAHQTVIVANGSGPDVRVFRASGEPVRSIGREGSGPGEFNAVSWVAPIGTDSILVYDWALRRFSVFDTAGMYARSFRFPGTETRSSVAWVSTAWKGEIAVGLQSRVPHLEMVIDGPPRRDSISLLRLSRTGRTIDSVAVVPNRWWQKVFNPAAHRVRAVDPGPYAVMARSDGIFYYSRNDEPVIRLVQANGDPASMWRFANAAAVSYEAHHGLSGERYFHQVIVSSEREVWVGEAGVTGDGHRLWHVLGSDGRRRRLVLTPQNVQILDVKGDRVLGLAASTAGVEQLILFTVRSM